MFDDEQFREELLRPTLKEMNAWSESAEDLLVMTCAHESLGGTFLKQIRGPALGIYQMEPATHDDLWNVFLSKRPDIIRVMLEGLRTPIRPPAEFMMYNIKYATQIARAHYMRFSEPLPEAGNKKDLAVYYKKYWNTEKGAASVSKVLVNYNKFIGDRIRKPSVSKSSV
jgi:hypothetical protein